MRVDVHCHILPESCLQMTYRTTDGRIYGCHATLGPDDQWRMELDGVQRPTVEQPRDRPFQDWFVHLFDVERRLYHMDQMGIDAQVICSPFWMYFYVADPKTGLEYSRKLNNAIAKVAESRPDRFIALGTLPMQDPPQAIKEMERAIDSLGMKGVTIGTNINGVNLGEPEFRPFFARAEELGVPIFLHPNHPVGGERLPKYHLVNLVGNPHETAIAMSSLIFDGVMEEFPNLKIYVAHGGGSVPFIRGRWDWGWRNNLGAQKAPIKEAPSAYLSRFYYDTVVYWGPALSFLIKTMGADKILLGTDYPFDICDYYPVQHVEELTEIPPDDRRLIIDWNAPRLFGMST